MMSSIVSKQLCQPKQNYFLTSKLLYNHFSTSPINNGIISKITPKFITKKSRPNIAVINLFGMIRTSNSGLGRDKYLNLENLDKSIDKAFNTKKLKAVCLLVNSPGGSPVQSELIADRIINLSQSKNIEVFSFVEDMAVSGGYWLALAGSKIYVSKSSIIGSIGVVSQSFGLHNLLKKYEIEHRLYTAGENKFRMNPFSPEKESDIIKTKELLSKLHQHFIEHVKKQRGDKLKKDDNFLFNGDFWTGLEAVEYGLVDGINDFYSYVKENYGEDVNIVRVNRPGKGLSALFNSKEISMQDIEDYMISNRMKMM